MQGSYKLIFEGLSSDDADSLRLVKTALVRDLGLSVEQVKSIFENKPVSILVAESREELEPYLRKLVVSGAEVSIEEEANEQVLDQGDAENSFEIEFDLDELEEAPKEEKPIAVYNLEIEPEDSESPGTLDDETYGEVSELLSTLNESTLVAKPEEGFSRKADFYKDDVEADSSEFKIKDEEPAADEPEAARLEEDEFKLSPIEEEESVEPEPEETLDELNESKTLPTRVMLSLPKIASNKPKQNAAGEPQTLSGATVLAVAAAFFVILMTAIPGFRIQTFDEPAKELAEMIAAEFIDIKPALNQSAGDELLGEKEREGFSCKARMYKAGENKYSIRISVVGEKPEEPSELEKIRGNNGAPWLTRLSVEHEEVSLLPDGSFETQFIGEASVIFNGTPYKVPVKSLINGRLTAGGAKARIYLRLLHGLEELEATDEQRLEAVKQGEFIISISSAIKLNS